VPLLILQRLTSPSGEQDESHHVPKPEVTWIEPDQWRIVKGEPGLLDDLGCLLVSPVTSTAYYGKDGSNKPLRLGINSSILVQFLTKVTRESFRSSKNVLVRPFRYLVVYESQIRQALAEAEAKCHENKLAVVGETLNDEDEKKKMKKKIRFRDELKCLVQFMDAEMKDIFHIQQQVECCEVKSIPFEFLWFLFKPGDLVFSTSKKPGQHPLRAYTVMHVTGGRMTFSPGRTYVREKEREWDLDSESEQRNRDLTRSFGRMSPFIIDCVYIDTDGQQLGPKARRFVIPPYMGELPILSLELYPAKFDPDYEAKRKNLIDRGKLSVAVAPGAHKRYSGMSIHELQGEKGSYSWRFFEIHAEQVWRD
jgi:hypothetical protein